MENYYYVDNDGAAQGPFTGPQLLALENSGIIQPQTLVALEGANSWEPWILVVKKINSQSPPKDEFGYDDWISGINRKFDALISNIFTQHTQKKWPNDVKESFRKHLTRLNAHGIWATIACGIIASILLLYSAFKTDQTIFFVLGLAAIPCTFLTQYILTLFSSANLRFTFGEPLPLISILAPRVITVISSSLMAAVFFLGFRILLNTYQDSFGLGITLTLWWVTLIYILWYVAWIAANSEKFLGVEIRNDEIQQAADYYFCFIRYLGRFALAITPLISAIVADIIATTGIVVFVRQIASGKEIFEMLHLATAFGTIAPFALVLAFLPIITHLVYIIIVALAETNSAFFRLVENVKKIADHNNLKN